MSETNQCGEAGCICIPPEVPVARILYHSSAKLGSRALTDFVPRILSWLESRAKDPLAGAVRKFIASGGLQLKLLPASRLPSGALLKMCPDCARRAGVPESSGLDTCLMISALDALAPPRAGLWAVIAASEALLEELSGVVVDSGPTGSWVRRFGWDALPADGSIVASHHVQFFVSYDERMRGWITSLGMARFGLPELESIDVPPGLARYVAQILGGAAQSLITAVETAARRCPGRSLEFEVPWEVFVTAEHIGKYRGERLPGDVPSIRAVCIRLVRPPEGERKVPFLRLAAPKGFDEGHSVFLYEAAAAFFPEETKRFVVLSEVPPELLAAQREAIARLGEVKARFAKGLEPGAALLVNHRLPADSGRSECVWSSVLTWKGRRIQALLSHEPLYRSDLKPGHPLELDEGDVLDWAIEKPDGTSEGKYVQRALLRLRRSQSSG